MADRDAMGELGAQDVLPEDDRLLPPLTPMGSLAEQSAYLPDVPTGADEGVQTERQRQQRALQLARRGEGGVNPAVDFLRSVPRGMLGGILSAATTGAQAELHDDPEMMASIPSRDEARSIIEQNVTGDLYQPQGLGGRYGETIGEIAGNPVNWVGPGTIPFKAAWNALAGVGSETAGQIYAGDPNEKIARFAGSMGPTALERAWALSGKLAPAGIGSSVGGLPVRLKAGGDEGAPGKVLAPFPQYATEYPPTGPPVMLPKDKPSFPGETYLAKQNTPEAEAFEKARNKIMANMNKRGFEPYFDPEKRGAVDYTKYPPPNADTSTVVPSKPETVEKYRSIIDAPETRARLEAAIARGEELGNANDWYFMNQLEGAYIKELGAKEGRAAFLDEFAVPMAATTSGQKPGPNFLMSHYLEYLRKKGEDIPTQGYDLPVPIGGRRPSNNLRDYIRMRNAGGYSGLSADQPKMHDFSRSLIGDLRNPVIDEQMAEGMLAGTPTNIISGARNTAYGWLQEPVRAAAAERGVLPGAVQDIAWAGFKNERGKPMIQIINEAIEHTHRLTGMAKDEIVRRGLVRKEIPIYGLGGAMAAGTAMGELARQDDINQQ